MDFSYSGDPSSSPKDAVRFEIADRDPEAPLLSDQEIDYCLAVETADSEEPSAPEILRAAALGMEVLSRLFAMQADTQVGSLHTVYSKQAELYDRRAKDARKRAAGYGLPINTARSNDEKQARIETPDRVKEAFTREEFVNPYRTLPNLLPPAGDNVSSSL